MCEVSSEPSSRRRRTPAPNPREHIGAGGAGSAIAIALLEEGVRELIVHDEDDTRVVANTVEELLRYLAVAHASKYRVALEDIDIAGETIHAGDGIVQGYPFANWDTTALPCCAVCRRCG